VAEEFELSFRIAAGRVLAWHSVGIFDAVLGDFAMASLLGRGGVAFCWVHLFVCVVVVLVVVLASACYVQLMLLLK
jgi:hypothetical protein